MFVRCPGFKVVVGRNADFSETPHPGNILHAWNPKEFQDGGKGAVSSGRSS